MVTTGQKHCTVLQQPDEIRKLGRGMAGQLHVVWGLTGASSYTSKPASTTTTKGPCIATANDEHGLPYVYTMIFRQNRLTATKLAIAITISKM